MPMGPIELADERR